MSTLQSLYALIERLFDEQQDSVTRNIQNWSLLERLTGIFDTVLYKLYDRKESSKLIGEQSEVYDT